MSNRRDTRNELLIAGAKLVRHERRDLSQLAANVTLTAVAAEAGVSRNTLRRHFDTKREYVAALVEHLLVHFIEMEYTLGDETVDTEDVRAFARPEAPIDQLDLAEVARHFAGEEMSKWAPPVDGARRFTPFDWNVLWLHSLIYLRDHPEIAGRLRDRDSVAFESLASGLYEPVLTALGLRPTPPLTHVHIAEFVAAVFDGYGIRQITNNEAARRDIEYDGRKWEGAALAVYAIVDRFTEPIPPS